MAITGLLAVPLLAGCVEHETPPPPPTVMGVPGPDLRTDPLTATDLPGWSTGAVEVDVAVSLFKVCGRGSGVSKLSVSGGTAAVVAPSGADAVTGISVFNDERALAQVVPHADGVLRGCPRDGDTTVTMLGPRSATSTGALILTRSPASAVEEASVYLLTRIGDGVIETNAHARIAPGAATAPLETLADELLAATHRKALGQPLGVVHDVPESLVASH